MAQHFLGDNLASVRLAQETLALATRRGDRVNEAHAHAILGWLERVRGNLDAARREFVIAERTFHDIGHVMGEANAVNNLGTIEYAQEHLDAAERYYRRAIELCRGAGLTRTLNRARSNLAVLEWRRGDFEKALAGYREVLARNLEQGRVEEGLVSLYNVANSANALGRYDEALAYATQGLELARRHRIAREIPWQTSMVADALVKTGRAARAKALWRSVLAMPDDEDAGPHVFAAQALGARLLEEDSAAAALRVLEPAAARYAGRVDVEGVLLLRVKLAQALTCNGRAAEGLAVADPVARRLEAARDLELALGAWVEVARAQRSLGRLQAAERTIAHATDVWERGRRRASDLEFREMRGAAAPQLMGQAVANALAMGVRTPAEAHAEAFARLQRFKTRTLLERIAAPPAAGVDTATIAAAEVGLARFQRDVLRPGELFLEYAVAADTSFLIAVTREDVAAVGLPGGNALQPRIDLALELCASPPGEGDGGEAASRQLAALARVLLGDAAGLLEGAPVLVVAPDGPLHRVPFPALALAAGARPGLRVALTPSATLLAALRTRGAGGGRGLLAVAGVPRVGERSLPGAEREVRALASRYRDVAASVPSAPGGGLALADFGALHFAGHAEVDDQLPWRSALRLGPPAGGDSLLTAAEIAAAPLAATLVVLSGCESAGGRVRSGEGVAGLASAFIAAGAPAVVATLWPVSDATTADLIRRFYENLAAGRGAAEALRNAQAAIRAEPATRHPFFWAGFVVIGDGDVAVPLERRAVPPGWAPWMAALVGIAAVAGWRLRRAARA
jgi:tetratricopeptide (TPR) repeat protein